MAKELAKIEGIGDELKVKKTEVKPDIERISPNKEGFDAAQLEAAKKTQPTEFHGKTNEQTSLMDEVRRLNKSVDTLSNVSTDDLLAQSQKVITQIQEIKNQLSTPNLKIRPSVQSLMEKKLKHADVRLQETFARVGLEYPQIPTADPSTRVNPIEKFISLLTHGQHRLQTIATEVQNIHMNRETINPADMLAIQIKVGFVQQELELFTNLLNKSLESIKTVMNVQV